MSVELEPAENPVVGRPFPLALAARTMVNGGLVVRGGREDLATTCVGDGRVAFDEAWS